MAARTPWAAEKTQESGAGSRCSLEGGSAGLAIGLNLGGKVNEMSRMWATGVG